MPDKKPFEFDELDADLASYVFQALGAASMCWEERPTGIFESTRAKEIGEKLLEKIAKSRRSTEDVYLTVLDALWKNCGCPLDPGHARIAANAVTGTV